LGDASLWGLVNQRLRILTFPSVPQPYQIS
jgi:hypothetical protein